MFRETRIRPSGDERLRGLSATAEPGTNATMKRANQTPPCLPRTFATSIVVSPCGQRLLRPPADLTNGCRPTYNGDDAALIRPSPRYSNMDTSQPPIPRKTSHGSL